MSTIKDVTVELEVTEESAIFITYQSGAVLATLTIPYGSDMNDAGLLADKFDFLTDMALNSLREELEKEDDDAR